ncbi:oxysterol-binding protein-related protein 8-like isoform X3 [Anneissia japonica]|uniref:oxysterol-binding protein-related protein 8-like isoform X2 n=1 Tax=Anneissia japonica TaxID=1529436 RepID=UPI0014257998|nr:oxysterol-binding protein-related protein 8-like isoform X2 [Anneissia japonica]XP_033095564.1 oxysterol-binding protein-related protein 8-like isoform X3 [Anneissia japonica]
MSIVMEVIDKHDKEVSDIVSGHYIHKITPTSGISDSGTPSRRSPHPASMRRDHHDSFASHSPGTMLGSEEQNEFFQRETLRGSTKFNGQRSRSEGKLALAVDAHAASSAPSSAKISKRESLKVQKKNYKREKKRVTKELLSTLSDPAIVVMADFLKVRGTLKGWTKLWCVLKPGLLILYKGPKHGQWVGTILLNTCELIERPSKKDGFCFKLYHPLDQSVWATKGPKGESMGAITIPLPSNYLIFRAPSEADGKCWMDALELALRCSSLLMKSMRDSGQIDASLLTQSFQLETNNLDESEIEKHFANQGLDESDIEKDEEKDQESKSDSDLSEEEDSVEPLEVPHKETLYVPNEVEELGLENTQSETLGEENKGLIWGLIKQVRPGMDLSKVVLPTFILEPRSLLDKLSDFYYHADMLSEAAVQENPFTRMKSVVKWYLSGFYKKPKGLKKPYNPIIGETYRCLWTHPKTNSRTFYIAEQVSHHPPISVFHISNRKDGFCISGGILAKSKFYGNSVSALMDGVGKLTFLTRGEDYLITMPYANCKGILYGTLTMEYGGKVSIECEKTGYRAELDFKLKPFFGGSWNQITGKLKFGKDTLATLEGQWDEEIYMKNKRTGESELFWAVTQEVRSQRLNRSTVALNEQGAFESEKLWTHVADAIKKGDQTQATHEKFLLEEEQRKGHKERKLKNLDWVPKLFELDEITGDWVYKHMDNRPWDPQNDIEEFERDGIIQTRTRHKTPIVRATSIVSLPKGLPKNTDSSEKQLRKQKSINRARDKHNEGRTSLSLRPLHDVDRESECSTPELDRQSVSENENSQSFKSKIAGPVDASMVELLVKPIVEGNKRQAAELQLINTRLEAIARHMHDRRRDITGGFSTKDLVIITVLLLLSQVVLGYLFK